MSISRIGSGANLDQVKEAEAEKTRSNRIDAESQQTSIDSTLPPSLHQPSKPSQSATAPNKLSRRASMKGELLRDQLQERLKSHNQSKTEPKTVEPTAKTTWGSLTPSARSLSGTGTISGTM